MAECRDCMGRGPASWTRATVGCTADRTVAHERVILQCTLSLSALTDLSVVFIFFIRVPLVSCVVCILKCTPHTIPPSAPTGHPICGLSSHFGRARRSCFSV